ncbi:archaellin/type IV pilin N-terminal domain-containing protein [Candidatus Altiarchaeota archaeon]
MRGIRNKGLMGIGTLIIFIAIILVAAVAATVLISTSGSLQQKSLTTGSQAEEGIATGAEGIALQATDGALNHDVEHFEILLRLQAGSEPMNLNNTVVLFDTSTTSQNLLYNDTAGDSMVNAATTKDYSVEWIKKGPDYEVGYLSRGDVIKVKWNCYDCQYAGDAGGIGENKKIKVKIIPRVGSITLIEFTTPDVLTDQRVTLWP